jgi:hypothetical protein
MFIVNDVETGRCRNTDDNRIVDAVVVMNFLDAITKSLLGSFASLLSKPENAPVAFLSLPL